MYQPQEMIQTIVNGWVYGVKKSMEAQEQLAKQAEQAFTIQHSWIKQGIDQQQTILQQWKEKSEWSAPVEEWVGKGISEQSKVLDQSWNQFQTYYKQSVEQYHKNGEQFVSFVEETGEKLKQWAQSSSK